MSLEHDQPAHGHEADHEDHAGHDHADRGEGHHVEHDHADRGEGHHAGHDHADQVDEAGRHEGEHAGHDHAGHARLAYPDAIANYRADKDEYFRDADGSPIPETERATFLGLPYFAVDEALRFDGLHLEPYLGSEPVHFQIPTSDGQLREAQRAGVFRFELGGATQTLTGYTFAKGGSDSVFVPFLDGTSGRESYGAGRYLDLYPESEGTYALDFNLAYHPSCVYDTKFSCPLTPAENRLPVRIEAGERLSRQG